MAGLILIPTSIERDTLEPLLREVTGDLAWEIRLCGFGPIASAARTAQLVAELSPPQVILAGIAGSYCEKFSVGTASTFDEVHCWGVGVGAANHARASSVGFDHFAEGDRAVTDCITLSPASNRTSLLTVCAASENIDEAEQKRSQVQGVIAEDMEGFGVATSCYLANVPLAIVRGCSNVAGQRNKQQWKVADALASAAEKTIDMVAGAKS